MPEPKTATFDVLRHPGGRGEDIVVVEEPLEIRVGDKPVSVTLRTPGDDFDLACGFLFTESILRSANDVDSIRHWGSPNVVRVSLKPGVAIDLQRVQRNFYSTSSCGVCGKSSMDAVKVLCDPVTSSATMRSTAIMQLPELLQREQPAFSITGGIHAAAAFRRDGTLVAAREDIGRHNAVDKVAGTMFRNEWTADALMVSGRTSFEIVQKCAVMRIPILAAVGAPSSLAVELARELGLTLVGFLRDGRFNVYAGEQRIADG